MSNNKKNKFYTEIKVGITVDSNLSLEDIQTQLDEGLKAKLSLTQRDGSIVDTNVLEVWEVAQWQDWEEM